MRISDRIFTLMKDQGMSQKEFAKRTGIAESTISDWKRKQLNPGADKLTVVAKALGVSVNRLLTDSDTEPDYAITDTDILVEKISRLSPQMRERLIMYLDRLTPENHTLPGNATTGNSRSEYIASDKEFQIKKGLARKLRRLARLDRLKVDESEHASKLNLHLLKYLDFLGLDKIEFIKEYLSHIQPYMITEISQQEKFENAVCVLDEYYRISVYIKVDATKGEEIVVSFHENNKGGVAKRNSLIRHEDYVYVFADSVGSHVAGTDDYSINLFIMRGVRVFPLSVAAVRYDDDGFMVRASNINNSLIEISNRYLEDLYTSDLDISDVELFSSLQQLSFTSFGNDVFSNISLLIDSLIVQKEATGRQIADAALCIYCANVKLIESEKKELIDTLKIRFSVNSVKAMPQILERISLNLTETE